MNAPNKKQEPKVETMAADIRDEEMEAMKAKIAELEAALKNKNSLYCKINEDKGTIAVYGLGRFPTTLYREQWQKLLAFGSELKAFMDKHKDLLDEKAKEFQAGKDKIKASKAAKVNPTEDET